MEWQFSVHITCIREGGLHWEHFPTQHCNMNTQFHSVFKLPLALMCPLANRPRPYGSLGQSWEAVVFVPFHLNLHIFGGNFPTKGFNILPTCIKRAFFVHNSFHLTFRRYSPVWSQEMWWGEPWVRWSPSRPGSGKTPAETSLIVCCRNSGHTWG